MKIIFKKMVLPLTLITLAGCSSVNQVQLKEGLDKNFCEGKGISQLVLMERDKLWEEDKVLFKCSTGEEFYINVNGNGGD